MPLDRELVEVGRTKLNEPIICCAHCHKPADYAQTVSETGNMRYTLACPLPQTGGRPELGSWDNEQQRTQEISAFIEGRTRKRT
jgi:hypothetical protein